MMGNNGSRSGTRIPGPEQDEDRDHNSGSWPEEIDAQDLGAAACAIRRFSELEEVDKDFEVLSLPDVVICMDRTIAEVSQLTNLKKTSVRILLNHVKWEKDAFFDKFYGDDVRGFFQAAGASIPDEFLESPTMSASSSLVDVVGIDEEDDENKGGPSKAKRVKLECPMECSICFALVNNIESMVENGCKDVFCDDCWRNYLTGKIMEEGLASSILCPGFGCSILVEDDLILKLLEDPVVRERYERKITEDFVQCHRLMKWCPAPDCSKVIKTSLTSHAHVQCECGRSFCFCCGREAHDPVNCEILKVWMRKVDKDAETGNWLAKNTKDCPKCNTLIEKNGGCNHMTCRMVTCRYEFCWVCLGPWGPHGNTWYKCNRFEATEGKDARDKFSAKRFEMDRFLFYSTRFKNHMDSLKFEDKLEGAVQATVEDLSQRGLIITTESVSIQEAVQILTRCRRTLANTYAFAFALKKTNECQIFEDNQRDLEIATENLSELLERQFKFDDDTKNFPDIKLKIINQSLYCEKRRKILLHHVKEGEILGTWEFLPLVNGFFAPLNSSEGSAENEDGEMAGIFNIFGT